MTRSELTPGFMPLSLEGMRGTHTSSFPLYMYWTGLSLGFCRFHSSTQQPNPFCFELTHHSDSLHSTTGPVFPHVHGKEDYKWILYSYGSTVAQHCSGKASVLVQASFCVHGNYMVMLSEINSVTLTLELKGRVKELRFNHIVFWELNRKFLLHMNCAIAPQNSLFYYYSAIAHRQDCGNHRPQTGHTQGSGRKAEFLI